MCGITDGCGLVLVGVVIYYSSTMDNRMIGMTGGKKGKKEAQEKPSAQN